MDIIEQTGLVGVEIEAQPDPLVIGRSRLCRSGWAELFKAMAEAGDDRLLDDTMPSSTAFESAEWEW